MTHPAVWRLRLSWTLPGALTMLWIATIGAGGWFDRAVDHWASAVTMLFGSFLAGSSPEGGGAVAFPVFTKALRIPGSVARSFGLSIQAVGMTVAAIIIILRQRAIHRRAVLVGSVGGVLGLLFGLLVLSERSEPFWPSHIPAPWVKASFSIVLATTSIMMVRRLRRVEPEVSPLAWNSRLDLAAALVAGAGGVLASMTGSGANIMLFLFLVLLADVSAKVALPTVVIVMAVISVVGAVVLGVIGGQLDVVVAGDTVTSVGSESVTLRADRFDLLGLWLAAVPVVVWGAPLGSWVAARVRERQLVGIVAVLAAVEVITTFVLVEEIRTEPALLLFTVLGLVALPVVVVLLRRHRRSVFCVD